MALLRIDNKTLRQKVYEELKQKMITAELLPGEKISLRNIALQLGVSLMPVREALWQLEREKAVIIEHNRHISVNQLSTSEFDEILDLRLMLECKAASEACLRRPDSASATIKQQLDAMAATVSDSRQFLQHNHDFHMAIYGYSEMPNLVDMIENLWTRVGPYIYLATMSEEDMRRSMEFHTRMYDALCKGSVDAMLSALRSDLTIAAGEIRPLLADVEQQSLAPIDFRRLASNRSASSMSEKQSGGPT
jgi:DNA-binding GntR family transcriptional regulator